MKTLQGFFIILDSAQNPSTVFNNIHYITIIMNQQGFQLGSTLHLIRIKWTIVERLLQATPKFASARSRKKQAENGMDENNREYDLLKEGDIGTKSEAAEAYEAERRKKGKTVAHESESEINSEDDADDKGKGKAIMKDKKQELTGIKDFDELEQDLYKLQQRIRNVAALFFKIRDRRLKKKAYKVEQRRKGKTVAHESPEEIEIDAPVESETDSTDDAGMDFVVV